MTEVIGLEQAVADPHFNARGVFSRELIIANGQRMPALPTPISAVFLSENPDNTSPVLGAHTQEVLK